MIYHLRILSGLFQLCMQFNFQYFVVDESSGRLLVQGKDQKDGSEFANLLLSNVKTCDDLEVDRNFCFQVSINPEQCLFVG